MSLRKPGARAGTEGARRISEAHRGSHEHDKQGGFAADKSLASKAGKNGIRKIREKYGSEVFRRRGQRGGEVTRERFGCEHFRELGRQGAEARRRKRDANNSPP